jgi:hypothetical protein
LYSQNVFSADDTDNRGNMNSIDFSNIDKLIQYLEENKNNNDQEQFIFTKIIIRSKNVKLDAKQLICRLPEQRVFDIIQKIFENIDNQPYINEEINKTDFITSFAILFSDYPNILLYILELNENNALLDEEFYVIFPTIVDYYKHNNKDINILETTQIMLQKILDDKCEEFNVKCNSIQIMLNEIKTFLNEQ